MTRRQAEYKLSDIIGSDFCIVRQAGADVKVEWNEVPLTYVHLAEIAELFGTDCIDILQDNDTRKLVIRGVDLD